MRPRSLRILVIDDNPADAEILRRNLEKIPEFEVEFVHYLDWESGRDAVLNNQGDCLLLDYHLGDASGLEVLSELRGLGADLPVIAVTGNGNEMAAVEALNRGAQDYLVKSAIQPASLQRSIVNSIEKVRLARALREKQRELEEFVSVVAHDLQQPLCTIRENLALIRDFYRQHLDDRGREFVDAAVRMGGRMSEMIEGMLAYSRVGRSGKPLSKVNLQSVAESVVRGLTALMHAKQAEVRLGSLPVVLGDEVALSQLLQNLIANGIKFRGHDAPVLDVGSEPEPKQGWWRVWVKDNGIGIDPADHDKIFAPFKRLDAGRKFEGSGIGLATCKKIVDQHQGRIWVESQLGRGTAFYFTLPVFEDVKN